MSNTLQTNQLMMSLLARRIEADGLDLIHVREAGRVSDEAG